ncbi:MAG: thioredoxin domain-containing protein [Planctomycetota bacterium]|nr:thioredoxin domain-containing protein [Planctomycetota bacterium]
MSGLTGLVVVLSVVGGAPDGVLLDFSASWCGPCQSMLPVVHRLQNQGYAIRTVDVDREPALAQRFGITHMPTFVLIVKGQETQRFTGALSEAQLRRMASMIPQKEDTLADVAAVPAGIPETVAGTRTPLFVARTVGETRSTDEGMRGASGSKSTSGGAKILDEPSGPPRPSTADVIRANISDSSPPSFTIDPMQACTRIRVKDSSGMDIGSGTIIHSEPGRTLILTCGHIFRHFDDSGQIEVDVYQDERPRMYDGKLIKFDLQADVGLVSISTLKPLAVARVSRQPLNSGQLVFSVGCGGGEPPSKLQHRVTSTTKFPAGYVECTGTPIQGRSGGGLFTVDGVVSGVCVLADPAARRGLYTGLTAVHALLDRCGLSSLYRNAAELKEPLFVAEGAGNVAAADPEDGADDSERLTMGDTPQGFNVAVETDQGEVPPFVEPEFVDPEVASGLKAVELEGPVEFLPGSQDQGVETPSAFAGLLALASQSSHGATGELSDTRAEGSSPTDRRPYVSPSASSLSKTLESARGAEVVCIIRDRNQPDGPSRIVIIHEATDRFVSDLTSEVENQVQQTSLTVRNTVAPRTAAASAAFSRYRRRR